MEVEGANLMAMMQKGKVMKVRRWGRGLKMANRMARPVERSDSQLI